MSRAIHKYPIRIRLDDHFSVSMPTDHEILCVQTQNGEPCIWVAVDPSSPSKDVHFRLARTGHEIAETDLRYIGTFQLKGGILVFHLFERR